MPSRISRDEAWSLLSDWVQSPSLRRHCLAVSAAMRAHAQREAPTGEPPAGVLELWEVTGLLHDADYERFPDMDDPEHGHPRTIMAELERRDAPSEMVRAIAAHADYLGVEPETPMERTLVAVDELCGFLVACAQVRPEGIHGLTPKSVKKKLKQPSFAAGVHRDEVYTGAELLQLELEEHISNVIESMRPIAAQLGLQAPGEGA